MNTYTTAEMAKNENVVMLLEKKYNEIVKAKRNAEYLATIDESIEQLHQGKTISFSFEELKAMESDDWKPTPKVMKWMERIKNN